MPLPDGHAECGRRRWKRTPGFTLVESVMSIMIVGVMLVAALSVAGTARRGERFVADSTQGQLLAMDLMNEILLNPYEDTNDTPVFGREPTEPPGQGRNAFDDVDDYDGWSSEQAKSKDDLTSLAPAGWSRSVVVEWISSGDMTTVLLTETGVKRITVSVTHNDVPVSELVAIRTSAWPSDAEPVTVAPLQVLFVVDRNGPTFQEQLRITMMESWGFVVTLESATSNSNTLNSAVSGADVAYVSEEVESTDVGTKLRDTTTGVVNEDAELNDDFGFSSGLRYANRNKIRIFDNVHYILSPYDSGNLVIVTATQPLTALGGFGPSGLQVLAYTNTQGANYYPSLTVHEVGANLYGGGTAAGRRVQLPWGGDAFDFAALNPVGQRIMKRSILWAAGREDLEP